jgi:hypothetical protein
MTVGVAIFLIFLIAMGIGLLIFGWVIYKHNDSSIFAWLIFILGLGMMIAGLTQASEQF